MQCLAVESMANNSESEYRLMKNKHDSTAKNLAAKLWTKIGAVINLLFLQWWNNGNPLILSSHDNWNCIICLQKTVTIKLIQMEYTSCPLVHVCFDIWPDRFIFTTLFKQS